MSSPVDKKVILVILDGFGHRVEKEHNAIALAAPSFYKELLKKYPHSLLETSGEAVGLPPGIMGNSEVGHLSIGSGRIILQDMTRISHFAETKGFESLPDFHRVAMSPQGALHFIGLCSDGGVHSDIQHLYCMIEAVSRVNPQKQIYLHVITDGRDTPPNSGLQYVKNLEQFITSYPQVKIATVVGRYYAMDRDKRWDRVELAYKAFSDPSPAFEEKNSQTAIENSYAAGVADEFIKPVRISGGKSIASEDQVVFFNFRADRAREISQAFAVPSFSDFPTPVKIPANNWITFTRYQENFPFPFLFSPQKHENILAELISNKGWPQLRIAETEKYAHVTYFFNGGVEKAYPGEERVLVASPKDVATYDLKPEMSAQQITDNVVEKIREKDYALVVMNYANGDMVGHTGIESAAVAAVKTLDECLKTVVTEGLSKNYEILITADHGNCEEMVNKKTGEPMTQHTTNPVPFLWISQTSPGKAVKDGALLDVAPTILKLLHLPQPPQMTGKILV